ncbi:NBR1-Ig-like domain-containing protein [Pseudoalteromonas phenolica]|uniref:NBR1-Ig-like domain-containing protein n=1 Tax=Pseudoalteromonas phenolica TaxID=161398 RepID=UPI0020160E26|nr:NBR1-Ig-like domain-containing protein [Pseudoalteromonas phenolica]
MTPLRHQVKRVSETNGLTIKQIVNMCECSRSHFYKVLDGQRAPSKNLQIKLMEVLEIGEEEFALLMQTSKASENKKSKSDIHKQKNTWFNITSNTFSSITLSSYAMWLLGFTCILACTYYLYASRSDNKQENIELTTGFATKFIKDVTIPDGSPIPINTRFVKTWRVQNIGTVPWKEKHLKRMTPQDPNLCFSRDSIPLPTVESGEIVDISIEFTTPKYPGTCRTDWKMVDNNGNLTFPDKQGLYSIVHVVEENL